MAAYRKHTMSMGQRTPIRIVLLCSVILFSGFPLLASGQDQFVGNVKLVECSDPAQHPHIVRIGYSALIDIKPGDAVFLGDTMKTGEDVRAQVQLSDGSIIIVSPNSIIQMKGYLVDREQGTRKSVLKTLKGTVRFMVSKFFRPHAAGSEIKWKDSNVTIEAQNVVAAVRGTDFAVTSGQDNSEIAVFEGTVSVRSSSSSVNGAVLVGAGEVSTVAKGTSPSAPTPLSSERKAALAGLTTLTNSRSAANGGAFKKPLKYTAKNITRDLAAGISLGAVIDKAVESGMPIEEVVMALLDANMHPSTLVYTALVEGYSAKQVVSAAVAHGAPLTVVAATAIGAGAERAVVISGAMDAGAPPAAIATAIANGSAPGAPVYGTPFPLNPSLPAMIPGLSIVIGGGGGGTPSASPYKPK